MHVICNSNTHFYYLINQVHDNIIVGYNSEHVCANACIHMVKVTCGTKVYQVLYNKNTLRGPNTFMVRARKTIQAVVYRGDRWGG